MQAIERAGEKPPGQEQWRSNGKTMRGAMETMKTPGADLRPVVTPRARFQDLWMSLGRNSLTRIYAIAQIGNARKNEITFLVSAISTSW
jgi:hypothetical protein